MEKELLAEIGKLYHKLLFKNDLTDKEEDVLKKLGESLDILNG